MWRIIKQSMETDVNQRPAKCSFFYETKGESHNSKQINQAENLFFTRGKKALNTWMTTIGLDLFM